MINTIKYILTLVLAILFIVQFLERNNKMLEQYWCDYYNKYSLTVKNFPNKIKTVGFLRNRYRLVHRWVAEMLLNVLSDSSRYFTLG